MIHHRPTPRFACLVLASLTMLLSGCGYTSQDLFPTSYTPPSTAKGVKAPARPLRTIAVPIFENRTFYRGVQFDLNEALVKAIELRTPYKVVPPSRADTILQGTITKVEQLPPSRRINGGVPEEVEVKVTVNFEWKDLRTGAVLRDRQGFVAVGRYVPTSPVNEQFTVAQHTSVDRLANAIVSIMGSDW